MTHDDALSTMAVERYKLGEMTPLEQEEFKRHVLECRPCNESLQAACDFIDALRLLPPKKKVFQWPWKAS